jgi:hypothetical protein
VFSDGAIAGRLDALASAPIARAIAVELAAAITDDVFGRSSEGVGTGTQLVLARWKNIPSRKTGCVPVSTPGAYCRPVGQESGTLANVAPFAGPRALDTPNFAGQDQSRRPAAEGFRRTRQG